MLVIRGEARSAKPFILCSLILVFTSAAESWLCRLADHPFEKFSFASFLFFFFWWVGRGYSFGLQDNHFQMLTRFKKTKQNKKNQWRLKRSDQQIKEMKNGGGAEEAH